MLFRSLGKGSPAVSLSIVLSSQPADKQSLFCYFCIAWDAEACALPRGCPHPQEAKAFLDFCAGPAVGQIAADFSGIAAREGFSTEEGKRIAERFLPMDFARAAKDKDVILARWYALATR